ncbi:hypothetical protein GH714_011663 [Hevea brasiliensis]|uniref:Uncharacterized protein n=1 Tax=Hevea brasiliensis TaxID=3981 RepID=A0A6A6LFU0_HEVBR|nr:hypothetical protein GH714_011663 [Hevea brasiliensis]
MGLPMSKSEKDQLLQYRSLPESLLRDDDTWISRGQLIYNVRSSIEKMLSEVVGGEELQAPLAKALAVASLSLKLTTGYSNSPVVDFEQFSPEVKTLQNDIAKAICDLDTIPKSLLEALAIINRGSRSTPCFLKEEIEEELECILSVSAQMKQIVWDLLPARVQEVCDETSMVAYNLIGCMMEKFAQEEGLNLDWSDSSYLRGDYSSQENEEEKMNSSERRVDGSVIVQVVEELLPSLPKSKMEKLKELIGIL